MKSPFCSAHMSAPSFVPIAFCSSPSTSSGSYDENDGEIKPECVEAVAKNRCLRELIAITPYSGSSKIAKSSLVPMKPIYFLLQV